MIDRSTVCHIPVRPFSPRLEMLPVLRGVPIAVRGAVVDIPRPRDPALPARTERAPPRT